MKISIFNKSLILVFLLLVIDQTLKLWVKSNMLLGEDIEIFGNWARLHFVENKGMAFGFIFGGDTGKLILSIFRLVAITGLIWYLYTIAKKKFPVITILSIALILTGAIGNILDSAFYGLLFSESNSATVATFLPEQGYEGFLYGSVVDMFHFPMVSGFYPDWIPWKGGDAFTFFSPVFNVADSLIFIGVVMIIIFRKKFIRHEISPK